MIRRKKATLRDYAILGGLILLIIILASMVWGILKKEEIARRAAEETKRQIEHLTEREKTLTANLIDLRTKRGQEASLRETYGVARPGEEVIIVVPAPEKDELEALPWWRSFLGWFGL